HHGVIVRQDQANLLPTAAADIEHDTLTSRTRLCSDSKICTWREGSTRNDCTAAVLRERDREPSCRLDARTRRSALRLPRSAFVYGSCQISTRFPGSEGINRRFRFAS